MSELAEFARMLHKSAPETFKRELYPVEYTAKTDRLNDIRAVICDVYGTMINFWKEEFGDPQRKRKVLTASFRAVAERFDMVPAIIKMNPADSPEKTLSDFYHGLISMHHEQAVKKGKAHPEIIVEEIWRLIITILKRHGYSEPEEYRGNAADFSRKIAWYYNFHALGRELYPGLVETLDALKKKNMVLGILSNAQFYTPIDLTLMIRDAGNHTFDDIFELFDVDLTFFSYEYRVAKPDTLLFRKLYDALYEYQILPSQTLFIGNDLVIDIAAAQEVGMKTALYTGDSRSTYFHDAGGKVIPDLAFTHWNELPGRLSFHSRGTT